MKKIKKGDIVARISYGKDIIFIVKRIINTSKGDIAILKGLVERVEADSCVDDLELMDKSIVNENLKKLDEKLDRRVEESRRHKKNQEYKIGIVTKDDRAGEKIVTGKILHLDGDSIEE